MSSSIGDSQAHSPPLSTVKRVLATVAIIIGCMLNPLNGSMAVTAYPVLSSYFSIPYADMSAMVMYFMATTALTQPLAGSLGDMLGRKNILLCGVLGFVAVSGMAANAQSFGALLFWRILQAACSGVIMANGMALISQVAPREKISTYLAALQSCFVAATVTGFVLGGVLLQLFDWRVLFLVNIPLGLVAFVLALLYIPADRERSVHFTALAFIGLPVLPLAYCFQSFLHQQSVATGIAAFVLAVIVLAVAIARSPSSKGQLNALNSFRFNQGCLVMLFAIATHFAIMFTIPAWAYAVLNIESGAMGVYFALIAGSQVLLGPVFGKLLDAGKEVLVRMIGALSIVLSLLIMIFYLNLTSFAVALLLLGCGLSATQLIAQRLSVLSSPEESRALAMGVFSGCRSVGGLSGNAMAALVLAGYVAINAEAGIQVMETAFLLFVLPMVVCLFASFRASKTAS